MGSGRDHQIKHSSFLNFFDKYRYYFSHNTQKESLEKATIYAIFADQIQDVSKRSTNKTVGVGVLAALVATIIWSGNYIVARMLNDKVPPMTLSFWRWSVGLLFALPIVIKPLWSQRSLVLTHWKFLTATAISGITIFNTLLYLAGQTSSALNLSLMSLTFPIFTIILARIFLNEKITFKKIVGVLIVLIGVLVLLSGGRLDTLFSLSFAIGDIWMILASLVFAIYSLLLKFKPDEMSGRTLLGATFLIGVLFLVPMYLWDLFFGHPAVYDQTAVLSIGYIGVFASLAAYFLWNYSVEVLGPSPASLIYYSIPLFSGLLAFVILDEQIGWIHLISGVFIVSGIVFATRSKNENH